MIARNTVLATILLAMLCTLLSCSKEGDAMEGYISREELSKLTGTDRAPTVIDVRTPKEFELGHIAGAVNIPAYEIEKAGGKLEYPTDADIVLVDQTGPRAVHARHILTDAGYTSIRLLNGQMAGWDQNGFPSVSTEK